MNNNEIFIHSNIKKQKSVIYLYNDNTQFESLFINQHLICRICKNILNQPKQCQECEENFCEECINTFINNNKFCINSCQDVKLTKTHPSVNNFLERLQFRCIFNKNEIINYDDINRHFTNDCKFKKNICKNLGCEFVYEQNEEYYQHNCEFEKLICPICKMSFNSKMRMKHNCGEYFIMNLNNAKEKFKNMIDEYGRKLRKLEELTEYINLNIIV